MIVRPAGIATSTAHSPLRSGVPQLIDMESAIKGSMGDMQNRMQQWLAGQGFGADTRFSLSHDAASRREGFAYRFSLDWADHAFTARLYSGDSST